MHADLIRKNELLSEIHCENDPFGGFYNKKN
jgi:hypothetical protein